MGNGDTEVRVDITGNVDGLKAATPQAAAQLSKLDSILSKQTGTTREANAAADRFVASMKREAETFGKTRGEIALYDAKMKGLTGTHLESVRALGSQLDQLNANEKALGRMKIAAGIAGAAIGTFVVASLRTMIAETMEAEQSAARLESVYRATGGSVKLTLEQVKAVGEELYRTTLFDDDQITDATAVMLTFKNVQGDTFRQAMQMSADLAALMKTDLQSAVMQLGKALEDPERGLDSLRRAGIVFTDDQRDLIKAMVETGNQGAALTEILRVLREKGVDGTASAIKNGLTKEVDDLSKAWRDLMQAMGGSEVVKGPIETLLSGTTSYLREMKNVIESGDWLDKLIFFTWGTSPAGAAWKAAFGDDKPKTGRGASGSWDAPGAAPTDPNIALAAACYKKGGKWDAKTNSCVLPKTASGPKPSPYTDVFSGQEYGRSQMNAAAAGQLGGFSYITNDKGAADFIREQQAFINAMQSDTAKEALKAEQEWATQQEKNAAALDQMKEKYLSLADPLRQYYQQLDEIAVLKEKFPELAELWMEAEMNVHEKIDEALDKTGEKVEETKSIFEEMGIVMVSHLEDAISSGKDMDDVLKAMEQDLINLIIRLTVMEPLMKGIKGIFGSGSSSSPGSSGSGFDWSGIISSAIDWIFSAQGNAFSTPALSAYRNTVVDRPTVFPFAQGVGMMGEKPGSPGEAIMPLMRMRGGDLGVKVMGAGGTQVIVNIIESPGNGGKTSERTDQNGNRILDVMVEQVKGSIASDISQGRGAIPNALANTYGLNRTAGAY